MVFYHADTVGGNCFNCHSLYRTAVCTTSQSAHVFFTKRVNVVSRLAMKSGCMCVHIVSMLMGYYLIMQRKTAVVNTIIQKTYNRERINFSP